MIETYPIETKFGTIKGVIDLRTSENQKENSEIFFLFFVCFCFSFYFILCWWGWGCKSIEEALKSARPSLTLVTRLALIIKDRIILRLKKLKYKKSNNNSENIFLSMILKKKKHLLKRYISQKATIIMWSRITIYEKKLLFIF